MVVLGLSLAALTAGLVAGWSLRSPVRRPPEDKPARALSPAPRPISPREQFMVFSAVKSCPPATPGLLPTANQIYCFYSFPELAADARIAIHWWHNGKDLGLVTDLQPAEAQITKPGIATDKQEEATNARPGRYIILNPPANEDTFAPGIYEAPGPRFICGRRRRREDNGRPAFKSRPGPRGLLRYCTGYYSDRRAPTASEQIRARVEWYGGDQRLESATQKLTMKGAAGRGFAWLQVKDKDLPEGEYRVAVFGTGIEEPLAEARFTVHP